MFSFHFNFLMFFIFNIKLEKMILSMIIELKIEKKYFKFTFNI